MKYLRKFFNAKTAVPASSIDTKSVADRPCFIEQTEQPLTVLQRYVPIRGLDSRTVKLLPHKTLHYAAGDTLFLIHQATSSVWYLFEGTLTMLPDGAAPFEIQANSLRAHLPINSGKKFGASGVAQSYVKILEVSADLIAHWTSQSKQQEQCVVIQDLELPEQINESLFFTKFAKAYRENKLTLPTLPDVALKLKQAMAKEIDIATAAHIIQVDPAITGSLIQIANSPLYSPFSPVTNCHDAVTRLGLTATRSLVLGISLKQLFRSNNPKLMKAMQSLWKKSLYLSSLSFVLAQQTDDVNPEDALLAGLISDIGIIPLLYFAEQQGEDDIDITQLEETIPLLRGPVGRLVLHTLGFSETLTQIPYHAEDWYFDNNDTLGLIDIVILAKLHSFIGSERSKTLPAICSIPAYTKLNDGKLNPDLSLQVLRNAQQRIQAAMNILS
jgi:HD-like signal output (HDOD) protein